MFHHCIVMIRAAICALFLSAACVSVEPDVRKNTAQECSSDRDCPAGAACNSGVCEAVRGSLRCVADNECPAGQSCINGVCSAPRQPPPQRPPPVPGGVK